MEEMAQDQYVEFVVNDVTYALAIQDVHEIIRMQPITQIPNHKSYVKGVINLRGRVLPVVDLRERMGLATAAPSKMTRILVANRGEQFFGVIVDQVNRVVALDTINPPPEYAMHAGNELMAGIAQEKEALINILHADRIFFDESRRDGCFP